MPPVPPLPPAPALLPPAPAAPTFSVPASSPPPQAAPSARVRAASAVVEKKDRFMPPKVPGSEARACGFFSDPQASHVRRARSDACPWGNV
ncbi:MAG: hypothetical protein IT374_08060 [Polyangiaceae bacterium]|nr:hypothetical protein [Polyangiaceae bacterium]